MHGRYPEDSNIIDFIYIKLISLAEFYAETRRESMADACYNALDKYLDGAIDVVFRDGEPWLTAPKEALEAADIIEDLLANDIDDEE
jgi:hypothetical protein